MTRDEYRGGSYLTLAQTAILFAAVFALLTNGNVEAQEKLLKKEYINPVTSMGFTQVVTVEKGGVKTIHVSGQVGRGDDDDFLVRLFHGGGDGTADTLRTRDRWRHDRNDLRFGKKILYERDLDLKGMLIGMTLGMGFDMGIVLIEDLGGK